MEPVYVIKKVKCGVIQIFSLEEMHSYLEQ